MDLTAIHQRNLQTVKNFMSTLASENMTQLMTFWAEDGVLEFPFHPPEATEHVEGKPALTQYFDGTKGHKKPSAFPITGLYPMFDPQLVFVEFDGELQNLITGEQYTNKYCVLFKFNEAGKIILFREYFDSLKRQKFETYDQD